MNRRRSGLPHNTRTVRSVRRPSDREGMRVRVGAIYLSAAQVRAALSRVHIRMVSLKRDMARVLPAIDPLRTGFADFYSAWQSFYDSARADWLAWGSNVSEGERYDRELDGWRERFRDLGHEPSTPTTSQTGADPSPFPAGPDVAGAALGIGLAVVGVLGLLFWVERG